MTKVAILVEDYYQVLELWYPFLRLREDGIETVLIGTGKAEYKSKEGYPAKPGLSIKNARPDEFNGVIIPGGYAPDFLRRYKEVTDFVREIYKDGKLVAAICHGGWVLISANILKGKKVSFFSAIKDDVINAGAEFIDEKVIVDGNLITSRKPEDLPFFCLEIVKFLKTKT